jgi:uncharacterized HAD superfamily protein
MELSMNVRRKIVDYGRKLLNKTRRHSLLGKPLALALHIYTKIDRSLYSQKNKTLSRCYIRVKNVQRELSGKCTFVSFEELLAWTLEWIKTFPETYEVIVGVPRSGLLVASIIATKLGKPLSTPELLNEGKFWLSTHIEETAGKPSAHEFKNILLVDDCCSRKIILEEPKQLLLSRYNNAKITKAALLVRDSIVNDVDMYYKVLTNYPPVGEWNLLHWKRGIVAVDMDGVICEDCSFDIDQDEHLYTKWLQNAKPYLIPTFTIDYIISNRLEKYRQETKQWLENHGVKYNTLVLWNLPSKKHRENKFSQHKINALLEVKPSVFWESSYNQALEIWRATNIPTICFDEMIAFGNITRAHY